MSTRKIYGIAVALSAILLTSFATSNSNLPFVSLLREKLSSYLNTYAEEKIYLQTDKTIYMPGEYVFFSAFLTETTTGKPSGISNIAHVELVDPKGSTVEKLVLNTQNGVATGHFLVGEEMPGGLYTLKAYTNWITNFGSDRTFTKEVQVQKVITPRLLLKIDFQKKAYGKADNVKANLTVSDLKNNKASNASIKVKVNINGQLYKEFTESASSSGEATLSFDLPSSLSTTDVLLQALVAYEGVEESISRSVPVVLDKIDLKFYPEGGTWVYGSNMCMAFEATNEFGKGADVSGEVVDQDGRMVASFESFHFGMGSFKMDVESGKKYYARILKPQGNDSLFMLPKAAYDLSLSLKEQTASRVTWSIYSPKKCYAHIAVRVHGVMYNGKSLLLKEGVNTVSVNTDKLPGGIGVFTLFDQNGRPICERLVMLNADKQLNIKVETDKEFYTPGEEVVAKIKVSDSEGTPVKATMGVAVVDEQLLAMADDKQDNILTYLMLASELQGKIYEPSFYFNKNEKKSEKAVDYLLLTHGWRMYSWEDVVCEKQRSMVMPETVNGEIYGYTVDQNGKPVKADVFLLEVKNKKRALKISTSNKGQFAFLNTDPKTSTILFTKRPNSIKLIDKSTALTLSPATKVSKANDELLAAISNAQEVDAELVVDFKEAINDDVVMLKEEQVEVLPNAAEAKIDETKEQQHAFDPEDQVLNETVVVAYGSTNKAAILGSAASYTHLMNTYASLQGRIAGFDVQAKNANPGSATKVSIRGASSITNNNDPLIVIDGVPMHNRGGNINMADIVNPEDILSLSVLKDASASALYGARAANGVIIITTQSSSFPFSYKVKTQKPAYSFSYIIPKAEEYAFHQPTEYYSLMPRKQHGDEQRSDFRTTVYWNGTVSTDDDGLATIRYFNNEANSAFRITAEGISNTGLAGRVEHSYSTRMPLSLDVKLPSYMNYSDVVQLSVSIRNNTSSAITPELSFSCADGVKLEGQATRQVEVQPNMSETVVFTVKSMLKQGKFPIEIKLSSGKYTDVVKHELNVYPVGFPYSVSISGKDVGSSSTFTISEMEEGSLQGEATLHLSMVDEMFAGVESILREPYGCFEQTSSCTFPNIFVMQLMEATGSGSPKAQKKAMNYIIAGYKRLIGYEVSTGGFEWFGNPPANEALTAYGLVEFNEMSKVYSGVSKGMIARTKKWLMERRNPDGSFIQTKGRFDKLSSAPYDVNCAYVVYALTEINTTDIEKSYAISLKEAEKSKDLYRAALMALSAQNLGKKDDYAKMLKIFTEYAAKDKDFKNMTVESTIVRSCESSAAVETASLWAVALMREANPNAELIDRCINFIASFRSHYGYGSTQATSLALKAFTDYAIKYPRPKGGGSMTLKVNNERYNMKFNDNTKASIVNTSFVKGINAEGKNTIAVEMSSNVKVPYSIVLNWNSRTPESSSKCPLNLSTELSQAKVKLNETVRLKVKLANKEQNGQPMSIAVVGIPAGLSPQPWQLKELQEKGVFDYYEISGNRLAFFYRYLSPSDVKEVNLDLKADIAGEYSGAASSGYLYYSQEERHWVKGMEIVIEPNK